MGIFKNLLPIVIGLVIGGVIFMLASRGLMEVPTSPGANDQAQVAITIGAVPAQSFVLLLLALLGGALVGGVAATLLSERSTQQPALVSGILLTLLSALHLLKYSHPVWFILANLAGVLPASLAGYYLTRKRAPATAS
ncbi:MAG: hypothetical protein EBZ77_00110 [Chitinophagia bacterium]|nr:hypothetical protein [Chitinophagia bacterium]